MGDYRRQLCGAQMPATFYDPANTVAHANRQRACDAALADLIEYMKNSGGSSNGSSSSSSTTTTGTTGSSSSSCNEQDQQQQQQQQQERRRVATFDATNSTRERRQHIRTVLKESGLGAKIMFVESTCDSEQLLEENIRKVKLSTPDYRDMPADQAIADFKQRREMYMKTYEPLDESDGPHIKIINSKRFIGT